MEIGEGASAWTNPERSCRPRVIAHDLRGKWPSGRVVELPSDEPEERAGVVRAVLQDQRPEAAPCRALDEAEAAGKVERVAADEDAPGGGPG